MKLLLKLAILLPLSLAHAMSGAPSQTEAALENVGGAKRIVAAEPRPRSCVDPNDTFTDYDKFVAKERDIPATYYLMSYSWSPRYCRGDNRKRAPGERDYLQCGSGRSFGYILHGLWPQGADNRRPRACEGNVPAIERSILENYLCMTPSLWLLQHEYENHGTCMHDEALEEPRVYFDLAMKLDGEMTLPTAELKGDAAGKRWWRDHNAHLVEGSYFFDSGKKEWRFCYSKQFESMVCPTGGGGEAIACDGVKGNVSKKGKKYYFTKGHPAYGKVKIHPHRGERCFDTIRDARTAGWVEAP